MSVWEDWPARVVKDPTLTDAQVAEALAVSGFRTRVWFVGRVRDCLGVVRPVEAPARLVDARGDLQATIRAIVEDAASDAAAGALLGRSAGWVLEWRHKHGVRSAKERRGRVARELIRDPRRTDLEIARVLRANGSSVATSTVAAVRARLGFPHVEDAIQDSADWHGMLGTMTDAALAVLVGKSPGTVQRTRTQKGIPAYRKHMPVVSKEAAEMLQEWRRLWPGAASVFDGVPQPSGDTT